MKFFKTFSDKVINIGTIQIRFNRGTYLRDGKRFRYDKFWTPNLICYTFNIVPYQIFIIRRNYRRIGYMKALNKFNENQKKGRR